MIILVTHNPLAKIAVPYQSQQFYILLRFQLFLVDWLKACQYPVPQHQPFLLSLAWICHDRKQALPKNRLIAYPYLQSLQNTEILLLFKILNYELNSVTSEEYLFVRFFISSSLTP